MKLCIDCKKWGTIDCPNSALCLATRDRPYFEKDKPAKTNFFKRILKWFKD